MNHQQYEIYKETISHTPEDFPYNTYICTIPSDFTSVPTHWHNEMELIVIKKGYGYICINLVQIEVSQGDIIFILPGQLHSINQKENFSMEYENIFFKKRLMRSINEDLCYKNFIQPIYNGIIDIPMHITKSYEHYEQFNLIINQIDILCSETPKGYQLAIKGLLFQLFFLLINKNSAKQTNQTKKKSLEKLKTVLSYVQSNYQNNISIKEISTICYYSESHFMKFFKDCMGISFNQYLKDYRLQLSAQLLKETDDNILDIAYSCGFDNLSYFNRTFKEKFNITPGKYRKL